MGFDYRKFGPEIADKTLLYFRRQFPDLTREQILEYIENHHANKPPQSEAEAFVRKPLKEIEKAVQSGWLK